MFGLVECESGLRPGRTQQEWEKTCWNPRCQKWNKGHLGSGTKGILEGGPGPILGLQWSPHQEEPHVLLKDLHFIGKNRDGGGVRWDVTNDI